VYDSFSVLVGGKAGDGINEAGALIARLMDRLGYRVYVEVDYPSLIRGGHNFATVRCSADKVACRTEELDVVMALNDETVERHGERLADGGTLVIDAGGENGGDDAGGEDAGGADSKATTAGSAGRVVMGVPLGDILKELKAPPVMRNTCLLGAFCKIAGVPWEALEETIRAHIPRKIEQNLEVARRGYDTAEQRTTLPALDLPHLPVITGNEAVGLGLIRGGCSAYVAYPMSPSSGLLHFMAEVADRCQLKVVHPENEIAVMLMALGMASAGQRAGVGTAGGGFCLMVEGLSLAGQAELPITIMVAQRPGPSTGLPTYSCQTDLHFVLNAGQGEFPRVIVAPGNAEEAYYWSAVAMGLSWRYQVPSIVLTDKMLCECSFSLDLDALPDVPEYDVPLWDGASPYRRYALTGADGDAAKDADRGPDAAAADRHEDAAAERGTSAPEVEAARGDAAIGVSPLAFPPLPGEVVKIDSYEHDERGITTEDPAITVRMQDKRRSKWRGLEAEVEKLEAVAVGGDPEAATALLCWGSNGGVCGEVGDELGLRVVKPLVLSPFPAAHMERALDGVERLICVENNAGGQLLRLMRVNGFEADDAVRRYDGRTFAVEDLRAGIEEVLS